MTIISKNETYSNKEKNYYNTEIFHEIFNNR